MIQPIRSVTLISSLVLFEGFRYFTPLCMVSDIKRHHVSGNRYYMIFSNNQFYQFDTCGGDNTTCQRCVMKCC